MEHIRDLTTNTGLNRDTVFPKFCGGHKSPNCRRVLGQDRNTNASDILLDISTYDLASCLSFTGLSQSQRQQLTLKHTNPSSVVLHIQEVHTTAFSGNSFSRLPSSDMENSLSVIDALVDDVVDHDNEKCLLFGSETSSNSLQQPQSGASDPEHELCPETHDKLNAGAVPHQCTLGGTGQ
ncbi:hypothetical protein LTR66_004711, partial [Elasticomyces elasticus]